MEKPAPKQGPERGPLCIPSFATERCRAMTGDLIRALETISPSDDQALEDRALACFVVACGELALIGNARQRDLVVEQLTIVGRKLVNAALAAASAQPPAEVTSPAVEPQPVVEPQAAKPALSEPVSAEPVTSESATSETAESEVAACETAESEMAASDPAAFEPTPVEPPRVEAPVFGPPAVAEPAVGPPPLALAAAAPVAPPPPIMSLQPTDPPDLLEPQVGLSWEQMEAVLKREKAERELGRSLT
jgi:hypothetical protein